MYVYIYICSIGINGLQNSLAIAVESGRDSIRKPLFTKRHSQPRSRGVIPWLESPKPTDTSQKGPAKDEVFDNASFCKTSVKNPKVPIPCDLPSDKLK